MTTDASSERPVGGQLSGTQEGTMSLADQYSSHTNEAT